MAPVAAVLPRGVSDVERQVSEPTWDSCDGIASTFGWDDVAVTVSFASNGLTDAEIFAHIDAELVAGGWSLDKASAPGAWDWTRDLRPGHRAVVQLLGGATVDPPNPWDLQATTPAAVHPVDGC